MVKLQSLWLALSCAASALGYSKHVHDDSFHPDAVLRVTARNYNIGGITRYSVLVNDSLPGPELRIRENHVAWVRVYNDMQDYNLTMHWHGLAQAAAPFSDGTPLASQWPIPAGKYFDYELSLPKGSAGTYFYHSHVGFQMVSASGPLIVDEVKPPYRYDGERIVYLQELFNKTDDTIQTGLQSNPFVFSGETNGFLINGETISNYGALDNSSERLAVIMVDPGKTYRFRWIGATALSYAALGIENHTDLNVIEADAAYTKPQKTAFLQVGTGQRFSTLIKSKTCEELSKLGQSQFYIQTESRARPANTTNYAILSYDTRKCGNKVKTTSLSTSSYPAKKPIDLPPIVESFLDYELRPLTPNDCPSASEVTRRIVINVYQELNKTIIWRVANVTWVASADPNITTATDPSVPYLVNLYEDDAKYLPDYSAAVANGGVDPKTKTFPGKIGEVLEIVFQNLGAVALDNETAGGLDIHPFHAHGAHYYDIGAGPGGYDEATLESKLKGTQPVLRDTTMLYRYQAAVKPWEKSGWRAWRLRVQEPGAWMIHCHTLQHMLMGMQTVWVFGDTQQILKVPRPEVEGYLTYGGSAYGNDTDPPVVVHYNNITSDGD